MPSGSSVFAGRILAGGCSYAGFDTVTVAGNVAANVFAKMPTFQQFYVNVIPKRQRGSKMFE